MQVLTLEYMGMAATITLDAPTSDYRCAMAVEPALLQPSFEDFCNGEDDGRGVSMAPGAYSAMGIQGVFFRMMGIEVAGVEDAPADLDGEELVDDDGESLDDAGEIMLDGVVPCRVREHYELLGKLKP
ncbi:hypothetical protein [Aeromonas salmonicida]|uniref:hypothetical protein n=1 Tax=Aeromonas salmonicida TaxID=645 RepID=UPI00232ABCD8|nr:hypothetical protein [Aeromonas salmonicida]WCH25184.1 hypothetical protein ONZ54_22690 [Aeromonas salmonicida]